MFNRILFTILFALSAVAHAGQPISGGMPGPWPFPWAKDCPVIWSSITGRYSMQDSHNKEMELQISVFRKNGWRLVHISRFSSAGALLADGMAWLSNNQRIVRVYMRPFKDRVNPLWASIKFYYGSEQFSCEADQLVPVLSLWEELSGRVQEVQYPLIRQSLIKKLN